MSSRFEPAALAVAVAGLLTSRLLGLDAVRAVLTDLHRGSPKETVAVLCARAAEFAYGGLTDDICLLAARIT